MAVQSMLEGGSPATPEEAAEKLVRDYCGWHVAPVVTETITLDGTGSRRLFLPSLKVLDVRDVLVKGEPVDPSGYSWSEAGILYRGGGWPDGYRNVVLTLEHGHEAEGVRWIVDGIVERRKAAPAGRVISVRVGQRGMGYEHGAGSSTRLFQDERDALAPYCIGTGSRT